MNAITRRRFLRRAMQTSGVLLASACQTPALIVPPTTTPSAPSTPAATATPIPGTPVGPGTGPPIVAKEEMVLKQVGGVRMVAKEVGEGSINDTPARFGLNGADLGSMFDKDGKLYMVFGDSFGCCIPGSGGPGNATDWRSNTMAIISDRDPSDGLTFDDMITDRPGHARELLSQGPFDRTVIPTYGVAVGERMILHYMAVLAWGDPGQWVLNESGLAYSDDDGHTWTKPVLDESGAQRAPRSIENCVTWAGDSNFGQVAIVKNNGINGDGNLYFFGIPGGRFGGVKLARVAPDAVLDAGAYRYYTGLSSGVPQWQADEDAAVLIVPPPVGELSVVWNTYLDRWIMTYLDESQAALVIREAPDLWGPWSESLPLVSGSAYPGLYGAYMHPWYQEDDGQAIYFAMSQWNPYSVFWMRAELSKSG